VLKAPRRGVLFRLYGAAEDKVIGVVLTQETEGKDYIITYSLVLKYKAFQHSVESKFFRFNQIFRENHKNLWHQTDIIKKHI